MSDCGFANLAFLRRSRLESNRFLLNKLVAGQSNPLPARGDDGGDGLCESNSASYAANTRAVARRRAQAAVAAYPLPYRFLALAGPLGQGDADGDGPFLIAGSILHGKADCYQGRQSIEKIRKSWPQ